MDTYPSPPSPADPEYWVSVQLGEQLDRSGFERSFRRPATRLDRRVDLVELKETDSG